MLSESPVMYNDEVWGLDGGWKYIDKINMKFYKKTLGLSRFAANSVAELKFRRYRGRMRYLA
jgi:hypothetical protein